MKTVIGLFGDFNEAQRAVDSLLRRNCDRANISVVANNVLGHYQGESAADVKQGDLKRQAMRSREDGRGGGTGAVVGDGVEQSNDRTRGRIGGEVRSPVRRSPDPLSPRTAAHGGAAGETTFTGRRSPDRMHRRDMVPSTGHVQ